MKRHFASAPRQDSKEDRFALYALKNNDAVTHINVGGNCLSILGRMWSLSESLPFTHPLFGKFASVEGFLGWVESSGEIHAPDPEEFRYANATKARKMRQTPEVKAARVEILEINALTVQAAVLAFMQNAGKEEMDEFYQLELPYECYYMLDQWPRFPAHAKWYSRALNTISASYKKLGHFLVIADPEKGFAELPFLFPAGSKSFNPYQSLVPRSSSPAPVSGVRLVTDARKPKSSRVLLPLLPVAQARSQMLEPPSEWSSVRLAGTMYYPWHVLTGESVDLGKMFYPLQKPPARWEENIEVTEFVLLLPQNSEETTPHFFTCTGVWVNQDNENPTYEGAVESVDLLLKEALGFPRVEDAAMEFNDTETTISVRYCPATQRLAGNFMVKFINDNSGETFVVSDIPIRAVKLQKTV